jgi:hypothetical protein
MAADQYYPKIDPEVRSLLKTPAWINTMSAQRRTAIFSMGRFYTHNVTHSMGIA